ncbi:MAG: 16S rRNA (adenine(1518)-N(6)/adenine(1519)-N(6))-dimethyltransferase RsmA [Deltaproteobacteria bacterium]|jgi:16S rRNA (adenine1518-N6/adenine1519-N6)-dimethyltransferase|nr:16S rRNA (adenine(1518)-N(6)/adenine(1519)-N(6))-dimethyltransferase RsmA [Deltaproteobacteria bacterium]
MASPRAELKRLGLAPSRARGQNFIADPNIAKKLAGLIRAQADWPVLEIGPGLGAMTKNLLSSGAVVYAIELDRGLAESLRTWPEAESGRLKVMEADALDLDLRKDLGPGPFLACGNLPYNISTPLLLWYMREAEAAPKAVFMLQREMAQRLCASPGGRDYGRLTVAASLWHHVSPLMDVPPEAFSPRPKVHSRAILLTPKESPPGVSRDRLGRLTAAAFHARRKTIINNLAARYGKERALAALSELGISPGLRPETLAPEIFASLALALE